MSELHDFSNDGFGWYCIPCEKELRSDMPDRSPSRLISEGEAESKTPELSTQGLAKWADAAQTTLVCPRCGITEPVYVR
jgi:hypothetical protein